MILILLMKKLRLRGTKRPLKVMQLGRLLARGPHTWRRGRLGNYGKVFFSPRPTGFLLALPIRPQPASLAGCPQDVFCLAPMAKTQLFVGSCHSRRVRAQQMQIKASQLPSDGPDSSLRSNATTNVFLIQSLGADNVNRNNLGRALFISL